MHLTTARRWEARVDIDFFLPRRVTAASLELRAECRTATAVASRQAIVGVRRTTLGPTPVLAPTWAAGGPPPTISPPARGARTVAGGFVGRGFSFTSGRSVGRQRLALRKKAARDGVGHSDGGHVSTA